MRGDLIRHAGTANFLHHTRPPAYAAPTMASAGHLRRAVSREVALIAAVALGGCVALAGCIASVQPIMPQDVATALAQRPMGRRGRRGLKLYYPPERRERRG